MSEVLAAAGVPRRRVLALRPRLPVSVLLAGVFLLAVVVAAVARGLVAPYDPNAQDLTAILVHATGTHWLGTDNLGRDVVSRTIAGARTALDGPLLIAVGSMVVGGALGIVAGFLGGYVDSVVSRWIDVMYSLPSLLVAIVVVGVLGGGYWIGVLVLLILFMPFNARLTRGVALEQRSRPYVEAARVIGLSRARIMAWHIVPTTLPVIASTTVLNFAFALVSLSGLSFLGLGVGPGTPDWGRMLADGIPLIFQNPLVAIAPGLAIALTALAMNLLGDWAYDVLTERNRSR